MKQGHPAAGRVVKTERLQGLGIELSTTHHPLTTVLSYGTVISSSESTYNSLGQLVSSVGTHTGSSGPTTNYEYDSLGRQTAVIAPVVTDEVTGELVRLRSETHYASDGRVNYTTTNIRVVVNASGVVQSTSYADAQTTSYDYDAQGRTIRTTFTDGSFVTQAYDQYGRLVSEGQQTADGGTPLVKTYGYDDFGRLTTVTLSAVYDPATQQTVQPVYTYAYDEFGNQVSIIDPLGHETRFTYDDRGRELSRTLPIGVSTTADSTDFVESMHYDSQGRLVYEVSFEGVVTSYVYDDTQGASGRLVRKNFFPNLTAYNGGAGSPSECVAYTYDAFGRQVEVLQDADGDLQTTTDQRAVENTFDARGQLIAVASPEGVLHYEYDAVTGLHTRTWTATDTSTTAANATTDTHYAYDVLGRLDAVTQDRRNGADIDIDPNTAGNQPEVTDYVYDLLGNLDQVRLPNGVVSDYGYDALNRLDLLREYKDTNSNYEYDAGVDTLLAEYDYDLAADGKRTGVTEKILDSVLEETRIDWLYDNLGRLTREVYDSSDDDTRDYTADYTYDLVGNRLAKNVDSDPTAQLLAGYRTGTAMASQGIDETTAYQYDANDRLLTETKNDQTQANEDTFTRYEYGANNAGTQQTSKTVHLGDDATDPVIEQDTYTYNLQGRMASAEVSKYDSTGQTLEEHTKSEYEYDANGIRYSATATEDTDNDGSFDDETPSTTTYLYDSNNPTGYAQILEERVNGILSKSYTLGLDVIAQALADGTVHFLLYDGHGSTRMLVDATGQPLSGQVFRYDAFGNRLDGNTALTSLLYSGELTDATGLQYLRARYYDPATGRFGRLDPFAGDRYSPLSLHKYLYCHGDGINGIDPNGLEFSLVGCLTGFAIGYTIGALDAAIAGKSPGEIFAAGMWSGLFGALFGGMAPAFFSALGAASLWTQMTVVSVLAAIMAWSTQMGVNDAIAQGNPALVTYRYSVGYLSVLMLPFAVRASLPKPLVTLRTGPGGAIAMDLESVAGVASKEEMATLEAALESRLGLPAIEGALDTPRTQAHMFSQQFLAELFRIIPGVKRVAMNVKLSKISGQSHTPDIEPDVIVLNADGTIDLVEIRSPSQTFQALYAKLLQAWNELAPQQRGKIYVVEPGEPGTVSNP